MTSGEAERLARRLLSELPAWLRHVEAVARRATAVAEGIPTSEADAVLAAAWLHDVGYASQLARTGLHHLDGAAYMALRGHHRLAGLIAHHSAGAEESELRGLLNELEAFHDERTAVADLVTYCDLTTGSDGAPVTLAERLDDVLRRYGQCHVVTRSLVQALPRLTGLVERVEAQLATGVTR